MDNIRGSNRCQIYPLRSLCNRIMWGMGYIPLRVKEHERRAGRRFILITLIPRFRMDEELGKSLTASTEGEEVGRSIDSLGGISNRTNFCQVHRVHNMSRS